MDNVLIYGHTQQDHDSRLHKALRMIQKAGVTLNKKCKFNQSRITFLGHVIDGNGVTADPRRPLQLWPWRNLRLGTKLRRSMGMINQLCKFTPNTADLSQQLRELLSSKKAWIWGPAQDKAFTALKMELIQTTIL